MSVGELVGDRIWGKLRKEGDQVLAFHPLVDHCADVSAVLEALLSTTLFGARLAHIGGREALSAGTVARLGALAALHDLGKTNHGFQNKRFASSPLRAGHVREVLSLFDGTGDAVRRFRAVLPCEELAEWGPDEVAFELLVASISHHGRPESLAYPLDTRLWEAIGGRDPFAAMSELVAAAKRWFPEAFAPGEPLPPTAEFQHAFSGACMLADWIGSDTRFFPYSAGTGEDRMPFARRAAAEALAAIGIAPSRARTSLGGSRPSFAQISAYAPRAMQALVQGLPTDEDRSLVVLESETGSGKTEAALARFLTLFHAGRVDGLVFALPTRSAATQLHRRIVEVAARAFPDPETRPSVTLAVPGYLTVDDQEGTRLAPFEVLWNDDESARYRYRGWAAENPKRYLAAPIVVATIDQVLLSTIETGHAHLRAASLLRQLLVVDEVHASDAYMNRLLEAVLERHLASGGHALLMSATLGEEARFRFLKERELRAFDDAAGVPYPVVTYRDRRRPAELRAADAPGRAKVVTTSCLPIMRDAHEVARVALEAGRRGARVLVLKNTVAGCVAVQQALEAQGDAPLLFHAAGVPAPHHARFAKLDRIVLDRALDAAFGKGTPNRGMVVAATQTVQQSLDLDFDWILTDLAPMDVFLQRVGRLHRHDRKRPRGFEEARVAVLVPAERDLGLLLRENGVARSHEGIGSVYEDLRILEATWEAFEKNGRLSIPEDNRQLVEATTHPEALARVVRQRGDRWESHEARVLGTKIAHTQLARLGLVDWARRFGDYAFGENVEAAAKTRLGEGDRIADFGRTLASPFHQAVRSLTIPAWMVRGASHEESPSDVQEGTAGFDFTFGRDGFRYSRLGLERLSERTANDEVAND